MVFSLLKNENGFAQTHQVILPRPESIKDERQMYRKDVLQLLMDKTEGQYGKASVVFSDEKMNQERAIDEIKHNKEVVTVLAAPTNIKRETELHPIKIPIEKGLIGYRILLINKKYENSITKDTTLADLNKIPVCFKREWIDTAILEENGFHVENTNSYEGLFTMLNTDRCGFIPRGVNEYYFEYESRKKDLPNVMVDSKLALYYPLPFYYFVSNENKKLAERIEAGFKIAIADGSFEKLFMTFHQKFIDEAKLNQRKIIRLKNSTLPPNTPLDNPEYWIQF